MAAERGRPRLARDTIVGWMVLVLFVSLLSVVIVVRESLHVSVTERANADVTQDITEMARVWTPESTIGAIDAIVECRTALTANAAPLLALERMMIGLRR